MWTTFVEINLREDQNFATAVPARGGLGVEGHIGADPGPAMQLFVRNLAGATIVVDASPEDSVHDVKARLEERDGVPAHQQRLACGGRELEDERSLEESGVDREATLHMLLRLRGGMPKKGGKGKGKAKADKGGAAEEEDGLDGVSVDELRGQIHDMQDGLKKQMEERNYFQLERDKINTFWEITKKELEEKKAELRNKDREMEEMEERHQARPPPPYTRSPHLSPLSCTASRLELPSGARQQAGWRSGRTGCTPPST